MRQQSLKMNDVLFEIGMLNAQTLVFRRREKEFSGPGRSNAAFCRRMLITGCIMEFHSANEIETAVRG